MFRFAKASVHKTMNYLGYQISKAVPEEELARPAAEKLPKYIEEEFKVIYSRHKHIFGVAWQGLYMTYEAARYVAKNKIEGDIVECGVLMGGCSILMAETIQHFSDQKRNIFMYDTYEGMPAPTEHDIDMFGRQAKNIYSAQLNDGRSMWNRVTYENVLKNIQSSTYPSSKFQMIKGKVEETIPGVIPDKIALLRLDTDFYSSTKHELIHLYPKLVKGGVLICDDFEHWEGARKAVLEYIQEHKINLFSLVDTGSGRAIWIKQ